jgi:hypothetical protein
MNAEAAAMLQMGIHRRASSACAGEDMPAGLPVALLLFAQAAGPATAPNASPPVYGPDAPAPAKPAATLAKTERECASQTPDPKSNEIVVCAVKPEGYRIDPDVLEARRLKKKGDPGPPRNPHETYVDHSCATIGPMGCRFGPTIDVVTAAMTAATMVEKAVKGENVGQMFVTDPQHSEYQLYLEAKKAREAKEADAAAKAIADAARAKAAAKAAPVGQAAAPSGEQKP